MYFLVIVQSFILKYKAFTSTVLNLFFKDIFIAASGKARTLSVVKIETSLKNFFATGYNIILKVEIWILG